MSTISKFVQIENCSPNASSLPEPIPGNLSLLFAKVAAVVTAPKQQKNYEVKNPEDRQVSIAPPDQSPAFTPSPKAPLRRSSTLKTRHLTSTEGYSQSGFIPSSPVNTGDSPFRMSSRVKREKSEEEVSPFSSPTRKTKQSRFSEPESPVRVQSRQLSVYHEPGTTASPPAAPSKKPRKEVVNAFKSLYQSLESNHFKYPVVFFAKGTFSSVYNLGNTAIPIIAGRNNGEIVLKAYHGEKTLFNPTLLKSCLHDSLKNYEDIQALGLPVAEIYNTATAETDLYIIQRKIPDALDLRNRDHLQQVSRFFNLSVQYNQVMDLQPQNFRVENGLVVLIDFVEELEDNEVNVFNHKACTAWAKELKKLGLSKDETMSILIQMTGNHYPEKIQELFNT